MVYTKKPKGNYSRNKCLCPPAVRSRIIRGMVKEQEYHDITDGDIAEAALSKGATPEEIERVAGWPKNYIKKSLNEKNNTTFDQVRAQLKRPLRECKV